MSSYCTNDDKTNYLILTGTTSMTIIIVRFLKLQSQRSWIIIEIEERILIRYTIDLHTFMFICRSS